MKWPAVERVWMPSWIADPETVIKALLDRVAQAKGGADVPQLHVLMAAPPQPTTAATSDIKASVAVGTERDLFLYL